MTDGLIGNAWTVSGTFTQGGTLTDPGAVPSFTVTDPTGAVTTPSGSHGGTGLYSAIVYCPAAGVWECVIQVAYPNAGYGASKVTWTVAGV